ncbi:hypothetical protein [Dyadobacter sandarakinus]|uniref:Addiction module component n=1 Tax=Dyadobacter sandarakinus TaxID=2747268 RepID=A0ABX7I1K9_9BACT|nr:hypothetical protein [Dyadobacter sandarakinus]QRQ99965.1 hypothetical protein HWI92_03050 [Dyadobacter sandarakinus]
MRVQYLSNEKGKKTAAVVPIKEWEAIQEELKTRHPDFWNELPDFVRRSIEAGQEQAASGETKSHTEVMETYKKYL